LDFTDSESFSVVAQLFYLSFLKSMTIASPTPKESKLTLTLQRAPLKISIMALVVILDQITKIWAVETLRGTPAKSYWGDFFRLDYAENSGAFLSFGSSLSAEQRFWIFTVAVSLFLLAPTYYLFKEKYPDWIQPLSLAGIIAGGIGNLIDRITRPNHVVVDFLNVGFGPLRTGIFNIADMAILFGVIALFIVGAKNNKSSDRK
jgi:signal peptidase II